MKRGKTDAADVEAICEAVIRPTMRFVAVKSVEQQAVLMLHNSRDLTVRQRTMLINALRGHLAEYGTVTGLGASGVAVSLKALHEEQDRLAAHARSALHGIAAQLRRSPARSTGWRHRSWRGTVMMRRAGGWLRTQASARLLLWLLRPPCLLALNDTGL